MERERVACKAIIEDTYLISVHTNDSRRFMNEKVARSSPVNVILKSHGEKE